MGIVEGGGQNVNIQEPTVARGHVVAIAIVKAENAAHMCTTQVWAACAAFTMAMMMTSP